MCNVCGNKRSCVNSWNAFLRFIFTRPAIVPWLLTLLNALPWLGLSQGNGEIDTIIIISPIPKIILPFWVLSSNCKNFKCTGISLSTSLSTTVSTSLATFLIIYDKNKPVWAHFPAEIQFLQTLLSMSSVINMDGNILNWHLFYIPIKR